MLSLYKNILLSYYLPQKIQFTYAMEQKNVHDKNKTISKYYFEKHSNFTL